MLVTCPFCHRQVVRVLYARHERKHTKRRPDGQMTDHITAEPETRFAGSLDGVPQIYWHDTCRVSTAMPEEIIRSYLADPRLYSEYTFCCGCHDYVPLSEVAWIETGQALDVYFQELRVGHAGRSTGPTG